MFAYPFIFYYINHNLFFGRTYFLFMVVNHYIIFIFFTVLFLGQYLLYWYILPFYFVFLIFIYFIIHIPAILLWCIFCNIFLFSFWLLYTLVILGFHYLFYSGRVIICCDSVPLPLLVVNDLFGHFYTIKFIVWPANIQHGCPWCASLLCMRGTRPLVWCVLAVLEGPLTCALRDIRTVPPGHVSQALLRRVKRHIDTAGKLIIYLLWHHQWPGSY